MIDLKDLHCLTALARHRHFARAAADCSLSQPAFSMRIRNLEDRLGIAIVRRGNRFQGLTREGELVLAHARQILEGVRALEQDVSTAQGAVSGGVTLGTIPTATAFAAELAIRLRQTHPGIVLRIETANSLAIQQGVDQGLFDAGITYLEGASQDLLTVEPLYDESYVLCAPAPMAPRAEGTVAWAEAAAIPLSLLEPSMQNRRILDRIFHAAGVVPNVICETGGFMAAIVMAVQGTAATIVPERLVSALGPLGDTVVLPLDRPEARNAICLVTPHREPRLPTVEALRAVVPDVIR